MAPIFYRDAQAALVTFDVTSNYSFDRAQWWVDELKQKGPKDVTIVLVSIPHPHQKEQCHVEVVLTKWRAFTGGQQGGHCPRPSGERGQS